MNIHEYHEYQKHKFDLAQATLNQTLIQFIHQTMQGGKQGFRSFSREVARSLPIKGNTDKDIEYFSLRIH